MRVIAGLRRGHKLKTSKNMNIRPTEDRIKESIFNIIGHIDESASVLDGFGGVGSIGIEFLSRGASHCYFVDNSIESINLIKENLNKTRFLDKSHLINNDIFKAIRVLAGSCLKFDYIYLDPPFRQGNLIINLLVDIDNLQLLDRKGIIIIEHEREYHPDDEVVGLIKYDYRKYGSKSISFYRRIEGDII